MPTSSQTTASFPVSNSSHVVNPPPLPPRISNGAQPALTASTLPAMDCKDPRSSLSESLPPDPASQNTGRRTLLLVYLHGFMGNETSFRNFPAHVHNLASITLAESHVVHSKLYPKYRSRYALEVARDDFSTWLTPHETPWTDVILLGHSMGGLVAADVALLLRHRIIGVINFDVPFLGMHPGIVKAGLGSIFKPAPAPEDKLVEDVGPAEAKRPSRISTLFNPVPSDPHYNPTFHNDVHLPVRKGWENTLHFINKHSNGLIQASKTLVKSHLEFGGAMADYKTLKERYARVRALEEDDEQIRMSAIPHAQHPPRVRFVNYYTASTGRPKKPKKPKSPSPSRRPSETLQHERTDSSAQISTSQLSLEPGPSASTQNPDLPVEEHKESHGMTANSDQSHTIPRKPIESPNQPRQAGVDSPVLPDIPPIPQEPPFVDLALYSNKAERNAAETKYDNALKEYQDAVKARNKIINERLNIEEEWEEQKQMRQKEDAHSQEEQQQPVIQTPGQDRAKEEDRDLDAVVERTADVRLSVSSPAPEQKVSGPYGNYDFSRSTIMDQAPPDDRVSASESGYSSSYAESTNTLTPMSSQQAGADGDNSQNGAKKKKLKKFCMLPPKDARGNKDPTWIRVYMEGIDEVAAHTSLFFINDTYERLVGDVGARIEEWVREADSVRVVRDMERY